MSLLDELKRGQYVLLVQKKLPQRPEHIASTLKRHPTMYRKVFITLYKFDKIPESFWDVYHVILRKGAVDGTIYGEYALTLHGRGRKYGNPPYEAKYRAGCSFIFTHNKGFRFFDIRCSHVAFRALIESAREVNAYLLRRLV